jgi:hypothetical protein
MYDNFTKGTRTRAELLNDLAFKQHPKFLSISKIWVCEKRVEILVNTNYNTNYLINLEPGNYTVEFGKVYGSGDIAYRELTGTCLDSYCLERFQRMAEPGLVQYKSRKNTWSTFGHFTEKSMAIWFDRGSYCPSIEIKLENLKKSYDQANILIR